MSEQIPALGGMSFNTVRRTNLSTTLRLIHYSGGMTRPEITREMGLNRSTVIALTSELVSQGLIVEEPFPEGTARGKGRPSFPLRASRSLVVLVVNPDVDGVRCALVGLGGQVLARTEIPTRHVPSPDETVAAALSALATLRADVGHYVECVGAGIAVSGLVDVARGIVRASPHLGWDDAPIVGLLEKSLGMPAHAVNDANAAAHAELVFGAGRGHQDVVFLHGTESGISGGIIVGGTPLVGRSGYAGQIGQNLLSPPTGTAGRTTGRTFDDEINRRAIVKALGMRAGSDEELNDAINATDSEAARRVIRHQVGVLSLGIASLVNLLNPQLVILGGFLRVLLKQERAYLSTLMRRQTLGAAFSDTQLAAAKLGADAVTVGVGELVFEPLLNRPDEFSFEAEAV